MYGWCCHPSSCCQRNEVEQEEQLDGVAGWLVGLLLLLMVVFSSFFFRTRLFHLQHVHKRRSVGRLLVTNCDSPIDCCMCKYTQNKANQCSSDRCVDGSVHTGICHRALWDCESCSRNNVWSKKKIKFPKFKFPNSQFPNKKYSENVYNTTSTRKIK